MQAFNVEEESLLSSMISYDFCIYAADKEQESSLWYKGLSLVFTGGFIWFMCFRKWGKAFWLVVEKKEDNDIGNEKRNPKKNPV